MLLNVWYNINGTAAQMQVKSVLYVVQYKVFIFAEKKPSMNQAELQRHD